MQLSNDKKIKISNQEINALLDIDNVEFPKYVAQLLNLANHNAQGTRPILYNKNICSIIYHKYRSG